MKQVETNTYNIRRLLHVKGNKHVVAGEVRIAPVTTEELKNPLQKDMWCKNPSVILLLFFFFMCQQHKNQLLTLSFIENNPAHVNFKHILRYSTCHAFICYLNI